MTRIGIVVAALGPVDSFASADIVLVQKICVVPCNRCGKKIGDDNYTVHLIRYAFDDIRKPKQFKALP
jgi:hypothetical protein